MNKCIDTDVGKDSTEKIKKSTPSHWAARRQAQPLSMEGEDPQLSRYRSIGKFGQIWPSWSLRSAQSSDNFDSLTW